MVLGEGGGVNVVKEAAVVGVPDAARGLWLWCAAVGGVRVLCCGRWWGIIPQTPYGPRAKLEGMKSPRPPMDPEQSSRG